MEYSTLGIVIHDMVIRYRESLWPGTNLTSGESRKLTGSSATYSWVGGWVAKPLTFAASSRVTGWGMCYSFIVEFA